MWFCSPVPAWTPSALGEKMFGFFSFLSVHGATSHSIKEWPGRRRGMTPGLCVVWSMAVCTVESSHPEHQLFALSVQDNLSLQSCVGESAQEGIYTSLLVLRVVTAWQNFYGVGCFGVGFFFAT